MKLINYYIPGTPRVVYGTQMWSMQEKPRNDRTGSMSILPMGRTPLLLVAPKKGGGRMIRCMTCGCILLLVTFDECTKCAYSSVVGWKCQ